MKIILILLLFFQLALVKGREITVTTTDGVKLHVTIKGNGIPCLYLHGGPGSGSYWLEKFMGHELEQHFQMIYLDQRGVSRSSSPEEGNYSLERMVMDFEELREALGIEKWITMGHSFGGILQMGYALRHPERILGMMMINCTLYMNDSFESSWCPKASEFLGIDHPLPCLDREKTLLERWMTLSQQINESGKFWKMSYAHEENIEIMNASFAEIPNWNWDFGNVAMEISDYHQDFRPYTRQLQMPVMFYYGEFDWMVGPEHYKGVHFPVMMLWESQVGHMPFMESQEDLIRAISIWKSRFM
jgi:proline iminopeptidase